MVSKAERNVAEELAYQKLNKMGFRVLLRNYECALGEVDLIAKKEGKLFFFAVNRKVGGRFKKTAAYYLKRYGIVDVPCEFKTININIEKKPEEATCQR